MKSGRQNLAAPSYFSRRSSDICVGASVLQTDEWLLVSSDLQLPPRHLRESAVGKSFEESTINYCFFDGFFLLLYLRNQDHIYTWCFVQTTNPVERSKLLVSLKSFFFFQKVVINILKENKNDNEHYIYEWQAQTRLCGNERGWFKAPLQASL